MLRKIVHIFDHLMPYWFLSVLKKCFCYFLSRCALSNSKNIFEKPKSVFLSSAVVCNPRLWKHLLVYYSSIVALSSNKNTFFNLKNVMYKSKLSQILFNSFTTAEGQCVSEASKNILTNFCAHEQKINWKSVCTPRITTDFLFFNILKDFRCALWYKNCIKSHLICSDLILIR